MRIEELGMRTESVRRRMRPSVYFRKSVFLAVLTVLSTFVDICCA